LGFEDGPEAGPYQRLVVDDEHRDHARSPRLKRDRRPHPPSGAVGTRAGFDAAAVEFGALAHAGQPVAGRCDVGRPSGASSDTSTTSAEDANRTLAHHEGG
jgi:hypothetical protein